MLAAPLRAGETWHYKREMLPELVKAVPGILKTQDTQTGRFGKGIWIVTDQNVMFPLAAAWAIEHPDNPYHHNDDVLLAIMRAGDALIDDMDANGQWEFRKKDGSTWGKIHMPWIYSRWVRAYGLIRDAMPADRREHWEKALALGYGQIAKRDMNNPRVLNIPAHHAMGLYHAGQLFDREDWRAAAAKYMHRVVEDQNPGGFWSENHGPVVMYNHVYVDALGVYYAMSRDEKVLPALERAAAFHANFTYPDGSDVETVDERNGYNRSVNMANVGSSFTPIGRGYMKQQWDTKRSRGEGFSPDLLASQLLYGEEGELAPTPGGKSEHHFVLGDDDAVIRRSGPWFTCISAYHTPVPQNRWIQDRQNLVSLFHDKSGVILGGGNTKLQPRWSNFIVGDASLLQNRHEEKPAFAPPAGLIHVPTSARLDAQRLALDLAYGSVECNINVELEDATKARLIYSIAAGSQQPVTGHVTFLPHMGKPWRTASGREGTIDDKSFSLTAEETGGWFAHNGWRVHVPAGATLMWPALPHNPYRKDGHAEPREGRIVLILPFSADVLRHEVLVEVE